MLTRLRQRNTNIEVLRLIAMILIVFNHMPWDAITVPHGCNRATTTAFSTMVALLANWGGTGDCLFFGISAWFLSVEQQNLGKNTIRVWTLQKQLWFWGLLLFCTMVGLRAIGAPYSMAQIGMFGIQALLPILTTLWWYPTSYVLFLLICPLLTEGLHKLSPKTHGMLCIIVILLYGFTPMFALDMNYSIILFIYLYTIITYVRWHMTHCYQGTNTFAFHILAIGLVFGICTQLIVQFAIPHKIGGSHLWLNTPQCLPSMLIAIALIIIAQNAQQRHSVILNLFAKSTLSIYLVTTCKFTEDLFAQIVSAQTAVAWHAALFVAIMAVLIYLATLCVDVFRQLLFNCTIDRHNVEQGVWIYNRISRFIIDIYERLASNTTNH